MFSNATTMVITVWNTRLLQDYDLLNPWRPLPQGRLCSDMVPLVGNPGVLKRYSQPFPDQSVKTLRREHYRNQGHLTLGAKHQKSGISHTLHTLPSITAQRTLCFVCLLPGRPISHLPDTFFHPLSHTPMLRDHNILLGIQMNSVPVHVRSPISVGLLSTNIPVGIAY